MTQPTPVPFPDPPRIGYMEGHCIDANGGPAVIRDPDGTVRFYPYYPLPFCAVPDINQ